MSTNSLVEAVSVAVCQSVISLQTAVSHSLKLLVSIRDIQSLSVSITVSCHCSCGSQSCSRGAASLSPWQATSLAHPHTV